MANTTNFNWETPDDTDLVKDGAAAIRTLGNSIDTSFVDLKGGTTGQILSKASNTDLDYTWIANDQGDITEVQAGVGISVASGTGPIPIITNSSTDLITTAGDILYGTAADTVARLGIGTAGQVLKVNSGATAPEWGAAGSSFVGCFLTKSATQSIANDTEAIVTFDQETYDTDGFHSTSSNTSRITIPSGKSGYYRVFINYHFAANTNGIRMAYFVKNGAGTGAIQGSQTLYAPTPSNVFIATGGTTVNLTAGDYIEMAVQQTSGGSLNLNTGHTVFGVQYLGA